MPREAAALWNPGLGWCRTSSVGSCSQPAGASGPQSEKEGSRRSPSGVRAAERLGAGDLSAMGEPQASEGRRAGGRPGRHGWLSTCSALNTPYNRTRMPGPCAHEEPGREVRWPHEVLYRGGHRWAAGLVLTCRTSQALQWGWYGLRTRKTSASLGPTHCRLRLPPAGPTGPVSARGMDSGLMRGRQGLNTGSAHGLCLVRPPLHPCPGGPGGVCHRGGLESRPQLLTSCSQQNAISFVAQ